MVIKRFYIDTKTGKIVYGRSKAVEDHHNRLNWIVFACEICLRAFDDQNQWSNHKIKFQHFLDAAPGGHGSQKIEQPVPEVARELGPGPCSSSIAEDAVRTEGTGVGPDAVVLPEIGSTGKETIKVDGVITRNSKLVSEPLGLKGRGIPYLKKAKAERISHKDTKLKLETYRKNRVKLPCPLCKIALTTERGLLVHMEKYHKSTP